MSCCNLYTDPSCGDYSTGTQISGLHPFAVLKPKLHHCVSTIMPVNIMMIYDYRCNYIYPTKYFCFSTTENRNRPERGIWIFLGYLLKKNYTREESKEWPTRCWNMSRQILKATHWSNDLILITSVICISKDSRFYEYHCNCIYLKTYLCECECEWLLISVLPLG